MKYALTNGELKEAEPGRSAECPACGSPVVAKCGEIKLKHWSHRGVRKCDPWWENETEWHREWKSKFPRDWQEYVLRAEDGEKHIADVKTDQGYVIEFQHSPIKSAERQAREGFYKRMLWIVNGLRRSRDKGNFFEDLTWMDRVDGREDLRIVNGSRSALLNDWSGRSVPVLFDFGEQMLWGPLPKNSETVYLFGVERSRLLASLSPNQPVHANWGRLLREYTGKIEAHEWRLKIKAEQAQKQFALGFLSRNSNYSPRRHF